MGTGHLLTEIDRVNTQTLKTFVTTFLTILAGAINFKGLASLNESKFCCNENIIALAGAFEPFTDKLFAVTIETFSAVSRLLYMIVWEILLGAIPKC